MFYSWKQTNKTATALLITPSTHARMHARTHTHTPYSTSRQWENLSWTHTLKLSIIHRINNIHTPMVLAQQDAVMFRLNAGCSVFPGVVFP